MGAFALIENVRFLRAIASQVFDHRPANLSTRPWRLRCLLADAKKGHMNAVDKLENKNTENKQSRLWQTQKPTLFTMARDKFNFQSGNRWKPLIKVASRMKENSP